MDSIDRDELEECYGDLMDAFEQFKSICKREDRKLFERWKAGGMAVSDEFISSYPSALEVYDSLMELPVDDDEEEDSELEVALQGDDNETA